MSAPPKPIDEQQRIAEVRSLEILDTEPEERFDRVTRLARRLFDVPIAMVSIVDDNRTWHKSAQGLDLAETPREDSFCAHAILQNDVTMVSDTRLDARFADNRFVTTDPGIRFYAGCPIEGPGGSKLGTLCLAGNEVRELSADELQSLRDLADIVQREVANAQLAISDPLTGLNNRRGFEMHSDQLVQVCERHRVPLTLAYFDLDHFKTVNDRFGHEEGDRILREFAEVLEHQVRGSDVVARVGGDEFLALLTHTAEGSDVAERIRHIFMTRNEHAVGVSFGYATKHPDEATTLEQLIQQADASMFEFKRQLKSQRPA